MNEPVNRIDAAMSLLRVAETINANKIAPAKLREAVRNAQLCANGSNGVGDEYIFSDVYEQLCEMIQPLVDDEKFPGSVVETVTMLIEHYNRTKNGD